MPRKTPEKPAQNASPDISASSNNDGVWNQTQLKEIEHFDLRKFIWILYNWNKLGPSVGKAYINGEIVDNDAFYTVVKGMISDCVSSKDKFPIGDYHTSYKQGSLGFGRFIATKTSLINIARPVRHTICNGLYQDIDFVNCHLYIYKHLCTIYNVRCDVIEDYINDRERHLEELCKLNLGLKRDNAKQAFLSILNGGQCYSIHQFTLFFQRYYDEFHTRIHKELVVHIDRDYPSIRPHVVEKYGSCIFNLDCKIISKVLEDFENRMRHYLCEYVKSKGFDFSSHCYDGGMSYLPLNTQNIKTSLRLDDVSNYISSKTRIHNPLKFKEFDEMISIPQHELGLITFDDFLSIQNENSRDYSSMKYRFEKENFFCKAGAKYFSMDDGSYQEYSKNDLITRYDNLFYETCHNNHTQQELFVSRWIRDPNKRSYSNVAFVPRGGMCDPGHFNMWKGFKIEQVIPDGNDHSRELQVFLNHLRFLSNHDDTIYQYLLRWFAHLFQHPSKKSEVLVGIKSLKQGVGKSLLFVLMTEMMGDDLTAKIENPERDLFGDFNELILNKFFVLLEEWDSAVNLKYAKRILDMITSTVDNINKKGGKKFSTRSYTNFMSVWNKSGLRFEENDRRMFATEVKCQTVPPKEYFENFVDQAKNKQALRAFYDYLMNVDLTGFHPSRSRPNTLLREEILSITRDKIEIWLQEFIIDRKNYFDADKFPPGKTRAYYEKNGFSYSVGELHSMFLAFVKQYGYNDYKSVENMFGKKLMTMEIDGFQKFESKGLRKYRLFIDRCIESIIQKGWVDRNALVDRDLVQENDTTSDVDDNAFD
jgi:hypothetical protein